MWETEVNETKIVHVLMLLWVWQYSELLLGMHNTAWPHHNPIFIHCNFNPKNLFYHHFLQMGFFSHRKVHTASLKQETLVNPLFPPLWSPTILYRRTDLLPLVLAECWKYAPMLERENRAREHVGKCFCGSAAWTDTALLQVTLDTDVGLAGWAVRNSARLRFWTGFLRLF